MTDYITDRTDSAWCFCSFGNTLLVFSGQCSPIWSICYCFQQASTVLKDVCVLSTWIITSVVGIKFIFYPDRPSVRHCRIWGYDWASWYQSAWRHPRFPQRGEAGEGGGGFDLNGSIYHTCSSLQKDGHRRQGGGGGEWWRNGSDMCGLSKESGKNRIRTLLELACAFLDKFRYDAFRLCSDKCKGFGISIQFINMAPEVVPGHWTETITYVKNTNEWRLSINYQWD